MSLVQQHPNGGWIWQEDKLRRDYIAALVHQGCKRVYLKVGDAANFWGFQCRETIIKACHDAGIEVWGWVYIYGLNPTGEIDVVQKAMLKGLDGMCIDAEVEFKDKARWPALEQYLKGIRNSVPAGKLAYSSYGAPQFHRSMPWKILHDGTDLQMPQIYFEQFGFGTDEKEVSECMKAHADLGLTKPILPIWSCEDGKASIDSLNKFLKAFPGSSIWRLPHRGENMPAFSLDYGNTSVQPTPVPETVGVQSQLPESLGAKYLSKGSEGLDVELLQRRLVVRGWAIPIDGKFGDVTENAVKTIQKVYGLEQDGVVGPLTLKALNTDGHPVLTSEPSTPPPPQSNGQSALNQKVYEYYSKKENYNKVYANVMSWFGTTSNGCVAFASSVLRLNGFAVPHAAGTGGDNISLVTLPFSDYLKSKGWKVITDHTKLLAGDFVFTIDAPGYPGYPAHVFVFGGFTDSTKKNGYVIDNQAFTHVRNIFGYGSYNFSPFKYALRAP